MDNRTLRCQVCGTLVHIGSRERFLRMVREGIPARCGQCRCYVSLGDAREPEASKPLSVMDLGLRRKRRRTAKRKGPLASRPLGRCRVSGYDDGGGSR